MNDHVNAIRLMRRDPFPPIAMTEAEFRAKCAGAPIWHSVDLGEAWIEGGRKTAQILAQEIRAADLPGLSGKTLLDIGAFGGFFSFEAARRGATVTAIDYYSWVTDYPALDRWLRAERAAGRQPDNYAPPPHVFDEVNAPGRVPFDIVNEALGNPVRTVTATLEDYAPETPFDVTLYLGVLYHVRDPIGALQKLSDLTGEVAVIETLATYEPTRPDAPYWMFHGGDSINQDATTHWSPTMQGLEQMLRQVGFRSVEFKNAPPASPSACQYRLWAHARK